MHLCEVKIMSSAPQTSWTVVDQLVLEPNTQHRFQDAVPHAYAEYGLGPWVEHKLKTPIKTRYLRLSVESFYHTHGGLARFEVWSDRAVQRYQIQSKSDAVDHIAQPGLRAEMHHWYGGVNFDNFPGESFDAIFAQTPVGSTTAVGEVNFFAEWDAPWQITLDGSVLVGVSSTGVKEIAVSFETPYSARLLTMDSAVLGLGSSD
jgi:hypothetical protein